MAPFRMLAKIEGDERHNKAAAVAHLRQIIGGRGADGNCRSLSLERGRRRRAPEPCRASRRRPRSGPTPGPPSSCSSHSPMMPGRAVELTGVRPSVGDRYAPECRGPHYALPLLVCPRPTAELRDVRRAARRRRRRRGRSAQAPTGLVKPIRYGHRKSCIRTSRATLDCRPRNRTCACARWLLSRLHAPDFPLHGHPSDFLRFSKDALRLLFEDAGLHASWICEPAWLRQHVVVNSGQTLGDFERDYWIKERRLHIATRA